MKLTHMWWRNILIAIFLLGWFGALATNRELVPFHPFAMFSTRLPSEPTHFFVELELSDGRAIAFEQREHLEPLNSELLNITMWNSGTVDRTAVAGRILSHAVANYRRRNDDEITRATLFERKFRWGPHGYEATETLPAYAVEHP